MAERFARVNAEKSICVTLVSERRCALFFLKASQYEKPSGENNRVRFAKSRLVFGVRCLCLTMALIVLQPAAFAKWKYFRTGNAADVETKPRGGFALMGGGGHQEQAFRYLCERANGGDFLILRANAEDDYAKQVNEETLTICPLNSAATIVFDDREDSDDPKITEIIGKAEAIFFAGGDQSNYVRFWQDTPIQDALNRHIEAGKPIGGSSAGLAILGEFSFSSMIDTIHSPDALADPYGNKVTLTRDFLKIPLLAGTITDTHFVKRDRLGRLLVFMARILRDDWATSVRAIAVEENAAVLLEPDGTANVVGGPAYFYETAKGPNVCKRKTPLTFKNISVHLASAGTSFDVKKWSGEKGENFVLNVENGKVSAGPSHKGVY
jgi:cyanophycinase